MLGGESVHSRLIDRIIVCSVQAKNSAVRCFRDNQSFNTTPIENIAGGHKIKA